MKRFLAFVLAMMLTFTCLFAVSCGEEENDVVVSRSFLAGYSQNETEGRVILNMMSDHTMTMYFTSLKDGKNTSSVVKGTYSFGENEEFDETVSFTLDGGTKVDATLIDSIFEANIPELGLGGQTLNFYETAPISMNGDVYVGYLAKTGGMGAMVYAYALTMRDDGTFDVSIMQMATVMHVFDKSTGTYAKDGDKITFTYDVKDGEGGVAQAGFTSEGTAAEHTISVGFNIGQAVMRASDATFVLIAPAK